MKNHCFAKTFRHGRLKSWFCIDKTVWFYTGLYTMCFTHVQKPWFLTVWTHEIFRFFEIPIFFMSLHWLFWCFLYSMQNCIIAMLQKPWFLTVWTHEIFGNLELRSKNDVFISRKTFQNFTCVHFRHRCDFHEFASRKRHVFRARIRILNFAPKF